MKLADQILPGTWTSEKLAYYPEGSTDRLEKETTEYSLTFGQDGTFTARFDREYTGTWTFQKVDFAKDYVAYYDYPGYRYKLTLEGADISSSIQILSHGRLYMEASDGKRSMSCWFNQTADGGADHAALAPSLIVGEWDAFELIEIGNGKSVQTPEPGAYTLTVREDSTFTLKAGGEVSGQWHFSEYTFQSGYGYGFLAEGAEGGMYYTIHTPGQLRAFYEIDGVSYGFMMQKK